MHNGHDPIPDRTLEAMARGFFNEAKLYGFQQRDYVRFVNHLLDRTLTMKNGKRDLGSKLDAACEEGSASQWLRKAGSTRLPIEGEHVTIRAFTFEDDLSLLQHWLEDDAGQHFLLSCSTPVTPACKDVLSNPQNRFGIITLNSGQPLGAVAYLNHDPIQRKAELRKLIGAPNMREHGFGKEATILWLTYGIAALGLQKIYLTTLDTNTRNIRLNEALGFKVEGILRNEVKLNGRYHDVLRMGLWVDDEEAERSEQPSRVWSLGVEQSAAIFTNTGLATDRAGVLT